MSTTTGRRWERGHPAGLVLVALCVVGYMLLRLNGMFDSTDTGVYAVVATTIQDTGSLTAEPFYSNGFGYPAVLALISSFTGISVSVLQRFVMPFAIVVPILAAYVTFREILDARRGTFATLLVLFHPFFLFSAYRSTHEKFSYGFILLAIYCLYVSFQEGNSTVKSRYIVTGYLVVLGITFTNVFFASSFIAAVAVTLACTYVLMYYYGTSIELRRLGYTLVTSFMLLMITILFLYPPAKNFLGTLGSVSVQSLFLLLGNAPEPTASGGASPYRTVFLSWNSFELYLVLISFYLVVYPLAGFYWLYRVRSYLIERSIDRDQVPEVFVLVLFVAFGVQLVAAIVADQTGILGGNKQLRVFPLLGFVAIVLATAALYRLVDSDPSVPSLGDTNERRVKRVKDTALPMLMVLLVVTFGVTGVAKATSDPVVSTEWLSASEHEQASVEWTEDQLNYEYLWNGYTVRLRFSQRLHHPSERIRNRYDVGKVNIVAQYIILSSTMIRRAEVANVPLPPRDDASRVYSNGRTSVYWFDRVRTFDDFDEELGRR